MVQDDQNLQSNQNPTDDMTTADDINSDTATEQVLDLDDADQDAEDDITFEQDAETRENNAPDAAAKVAKLKSEIEKLKSEKQQYLDNWQRDKAEFINARKRDEEAKADYIKFAHVNFVEDMLPVIDSFESALRHTAGQPTTEDKDTTGMSLIYNQFKSVLKKYNVEAIGTIGEDFNPNLHQAIGSTPLTGDAKDHTVSDIMQLGYKSGDKVIRPAMVKVFQA